MRSMVHVTNKLCRVCGRPRWFRTVRNQRKSLFDQFLTGFHQFQDFEVVFRYIKQIFFEISEEKKVFRKLLFQTRRMTKYELMTPYQLGVIQNLSFGFLTVKN